MRKMIVGMLALAALCGSAFAAQDVPAEAEATGVTTPVRLTLRVYKKKIKAGESLWFQIRLKNVGKKTLLVTDQMFRDPDVLLDSSLKHWGIYLEAVDSDGEPLPIMPKFHGKPDRDAVTGLVETRGPEEQAMVDGWKKQGLSDVEVAEKLVDYNRRKQDEKADREHPPTIDLKPGSSIRMSTGLLGNLVPRLSANINCWSFFGSQSRAFLRYGQCTSIARAKAARGVMKG
jgi:hypothetical protein